MSLFLNVPSWVERGASKFPSLNSYAELFKPFKTDDKSITRVHQSGQLKELIESSPIEELICITGTVTQTMPAFLSYTIMNKWVKSGIRCMWAPMRLGRMPFVDNADDYADGNLKVVTFFNILPDSHMQRLEKLRDALDIAAERRITRILVLGGENPYKFCTERLRMRPNTGLYISSNI